MNYKGMILDALNQEIPEGYYRRLDNGVLDKTKQAITEELGTNQVFSVSIDGYTVDIMEVIDLSDRKIIMSNLYATDKSNKGEIGIYDGTYTPLIRDKNILFDHTRSIEYTYFTNNLGEHIILWNNPQPSYLNIDNPNVEISAYSLTDPSELLLFPNIIYPIIDTVDISSGGSLLAGSYQIAIKYLNEDGTETSYLGHSNPINIISDSLGQPYDNIKGNWSGEPTNKLIKIGYKEIDSKFEHIKIGVKANYSGLQSSSSENTMGTIYYESPKIPNQSNNIVFSSIDSFNQITEEQFKIEYPTFESIGTLTIDKNRLVIGNLSTQKEDDYQSAVNDIQVNWVYGKETDINNPINSFKDGVHTYFSKGFMPGEVYALYIRFIYKNGTKSKAYHIPGREADDTNEIFNIGGTPYYETDIVPTTTTEGEEYGNLKCFHTRDTTKVNGNGINTMGYWENSSEQYPTDFPDFAGDNVRHHRMPSLKKLIDEYDFLTTEIIGFSDTLTSSLSSNGDTYASNYVDLSSGAQAVFSITDELGTTGGTITYTFSAKTYVKIDYKILVQDAYMGVYQADSSGNKLITIRELDVRETGSSTLWISTNMTFQPNEKLVISLVDGDTAWYRPSLFNLTVSDSEINSAASIVVKNIGLRFSNIEIDDPDIQAFEILYAKRSYQNSTISGYSQTFYINPTTGNAMSSATNNSEGADGALYPPDLLVNEEYPRAVIQYIRQEYNFISPLSNANLDTAYSNSQVDLVCPLNNVEYKPITSEDYSTTRISFNYGANFTLDDGGSHTSMVVSLHTGNLDPYYNYAAQELVSTGYVQKLNGVTEHVYGGDTYVDNFSWFTNEADGESTTIFNIVIPTVSNLALRLTGVEDYETFYPYESESNLNGTVGGFTFPNEEGINSGYHKFDNYIWSNPAYRKLNDTIAVIQTPNNENPNIFNNRVYLSEVIKTEGKTTSFKKFLPLNYKDLNPVFGALVKLVSFNNELYIFQNKGISKTVTKVIIKSNENTAYIGSGNIFEVEPQPLLDDDKGYIGVKYSNEVFKFINGIVFINQKNGKVGMITDKLNIISNNYAKDYFKEFVDFKLNKQVQDATDETIYNSNPKTSLGTGFVFGYDDDNERLLITKRDYTVTTSIIPSSFMVATLIDGIIAEAGDDYGYPQRYVLHKVATPGLQSILDSYNAGNEVRIKDFNNRLHTVDVYTGSDFDSSLTGDIVFLFNINDPVLGSAFDLTATNDNVYVEYKAIQDEDHAYIENGFITNTYNLPIGDFDVRQDITIAYCLTNQAWQSFPHYNCKGYCHFDKYLGSFDDTSIYEHSDNDFNYFHGEYQNLAFTGIAGNDKPGRKFFTTIQWLTESISNNGFNYFDTFDKIWVFNDYQSSNIIKLIPYNKPNGNVRKVKGIHNFKQFRDLLYTPDTKFIVDNELVTSAINTNKEWYEKKKFISNYLLYKLIKEPNENRLYLYYSGAMYNQSNR